MMASTARWHFREFQPGDVASDPDFARALFTRDEAEVSRSLVREAIQNSLDARKGGERVRVHFTLRTGEHALKAPVSPFFDGLWEHVQSPDSGIQGAPREHESVPFLAIEDFGTRGLTGDPLAWRPFDGKDNAFFLFFRALGRSGKEGEDRGRWGVGKFVFPMASRAHAFLAFSITGSPERHLLMGRAVLRIHRAAGNSYHPDGHWGIRDGDALVCPVSDSHLIESFRHYFSLQRKHETGLSVVVPWISNEITRDDLVQAVVEEYFVPILRDELEVTVDANGEIEVIDADRLANLADKVASPSVATRIQLALEALTCPDEALLVVPIVGGAEYDWNSERLTDEQRAQIASALETGRAIGIRVNTHIRPREGRSLPAHFDVFMQRVPGLGRQRPLIVREGITIPQDKTAFVQDCAALVLVDRGALAAFVGDAETPAHNELQHQLVKAKYVLAKKLLTFIRDAPAAILREVSSSNQQPDRSILSRFFPFERRDGGAPHGRPRESSEGAGGHADPSVPRRPRHFEITQIDAGFRVVGTGSLKPGARMTVEFAYEVRRGNPLRKYRQLDFAIGRDIACSATGARILHASANRLEAQVTEADFRIEVRGFDRNRDIYVRVSADEPGSR